jgi:hypothetical protein
MQPVVNGCSVWGNVTAQLMRMNVGGVSSSELANIRYAKFRLPE